MIMLSTVYSAGLFGIDGFVVSVEVDGQNRLAEFELVGLPDAAVKEARERVRAAAKSSGLGFPVSRITVNLAPANLAYWTTEDGALYSVSDVLILGGGIVGQGALSVLYALGANVTVMDINPGLLRTLGNQYNQKINTMFCTQETIASVLPQTDMVINCVKWPKQRKDFLITKEALKLMEPGSVLVDISNDDPGAIESSHETHHDNPRYVVNGVVHYCVSNIPGAVAHSTSVALAGETLPMLLNIMNNGLEEACVRDGFIRRSLTAYKGYLTHEETSGIQGRPWIKPEDILGIADRKLDPAPPATTTRSTNFIKK